MSIGAKEIVRARELYVDIGNWLWVWQAATWTYFARCRSADPGQDHLVVTLVKVSPKPTDRLAIYCMQDMEMQLNEREVPLVDAFRRLQRSKNIHAKKSSAKLALSLPEP